MELLPRLCGPQSELALLRVCCGISKFYFCLRTIRPSAVVEAQKVFDGALRKSLDWIVTGGGSEFSDLQWQLATLPMKNGGLGVYSAFDAMKYAFIASYS